MTKPIEIYLTLAQITQRFGISHTTVYRWIRDRNFPQRIQLGANTIRWRKSEVDAWEADLEKAL